MKIAIALTTGCERYGLFTCLHQQCSTKWMAYKYAVTWEEPWRGVGNGCAPTADSTRVKGKTLDLR